MRKIDPAFLYGLGAAIRPAYRITTTTPYIDAYTIVKDAAEAVDSVCVQSIYSHALRQTPGRGQALKLACSGFQELILSSGNWDNPFDEGVVSNLHAAVTNFEQALTVELQNESIYYVDGAGPYDVERLLTRGEDLFPKALMAKAPETRRDVQEGARALVLQLWTAVGFHFHRANEAVLRRYFDHVAAPEKRPDNASMGVLLTKLKQLKKGDPSIIAALDNIREFHRNPLMHPDHHIETSDQAENLYAAIRAAMGYMLEQLPDVAPPIVVTPAAQ